MRKPVILDVETKYTFRQYADPKKLGISVAAIYDYQKEKAFTFLETEINKLFPYLENASVIIGFNINSFDLPVIQGYYPGNINQFNTFDILEEIKKIVGQRLALNDLIKATLGKKKTGHGLQAINFYQEGKIEELKKYCLDDVMLTKELFDYGVNHEKIYYLHLNDKIAIKVNWKKYLTQNKNNSGVSLTLPF